MDYTYDKVNLRRRGSQEEEVSNSKLRPGIYLGRIDQKRRKLDGTFTHTRRKRSAEFAERTKQRTHALDARC